MNRLPIGITTGDPAGIGPELTLQLLNDPRALERCQPVVFSDAAVLRRVAQQLARPFSIDVLPLTDWKANPNIDHPAVIDCEALNADAIVPGRVCGDCGAAAFTYIREAIDAAMKGSIKAVVTGPIHKESLRQAGIDYPGHTEIFTDLTRARRSCMMLTGPDLTCTFATTHVGYLDVPARLSVERILDVIELTADAMRILRARAPRLSVCGLNPHAGEHGLFGRREEETLIVPAIESARRKGIDVTGPLPPDTAFVPALRKEIDAVVCMYHDQGHIPMKMLAFDRGVNVTLGLPIIRTSVDHGTAFDIAWQGRANPNSLIEALLLALRMAEG